MPKFNLKNFATLVAQLAPIILPIAGVPAALVGLVIHGIIVAENTPHATGPEKKVYAKELVKTAAEGVNAGAGKILVNADQITGAVGIGIDAVIAAVNTVKNIPVKP
jgi:hypothetical protein